MFWILQDPVPVSLCVSQYASVRLYVLLSAVSSPDKQQAAPLESAAAFP